jgi:hypothetical protein
MQMRCPWRGSTRKAGELRLQFQHFVLLDKEWPATALEVVVMGIFYLLDVDFAFPAVELAGFIEYEGGFIDSDEFIAYDTPHELAMHAWKGVTGVQNLLKKSLGLTFNRLPVQNAPPSE